MAHGADKKREARKRYVFDRQALPVVALAIGASEATVGRWKREARDAGDNWDTARSAQTIAGEGLQALVMTVVEDYVVQHQATIEMLRTDAELSPGEKAKVLASLADAFQKTVASAGRLTPKVSELGVAMDVLRRLAEYVRERHPRHAPALLEILEPFGNLISEVYQ